MTSNAERVCDQELVQVLYYVLLGRDPESSDILIGTPVSEAARHILESDEFRTVANACLNLDFSLPATKKSRAARAAVSELLVQYGAPRPRTDLWQDLLLSGLTWLEAIVRQDSTAKVIEPVIKVIESEFHGEPEVDELLREVNQFDAKWFLSANKHVAGLEQLTDADLRSFAARSAFMGDADLMPHFSTTGDDKRELRRQLFYSKDTNSEPTLDVLLGRMRVAAEKGILTHWLFDEDYYLRMRAKMFGERPIDSWEPLEKPYLDFIVNGDRNAVRPHPLFCPTAYRVLNPGVASDAKPFDHYVRSGQFQHLRTSALFDPEFYLTLNPSASLDIASGRFRSALESFCKEGANANYTFSPDFDAAYYLTSYEDVAQANWSGSLSAGWHFLKEGVLTGRRANPYFDSEYYLLRYPHVAGLCDDLAISPLEHFLLFGRQDGLRPSKPLADREIELSQAKGLYERRALDSLIRLSRNSLDFSDFNGPDPIISVIMPVHDQISFTARFLELAYYACAELKRRLGHNVEIIVVNNNSRDGTDAFLRTFGGIKPIVTEECLGFTRAVNVGAKAASGKFLLIVNNDIEFDPNIFADLVTSFVETPNCGVMGVRVLSMDMTVQEAGAFIASDGSTGGHERGIRSSRHSGRHRESVDYVSGCFMCLERTDFNSLGGLDEVFSPGYYEEVDLCLRVVEQLGKEIIVDLALSISHYENASFMKGRPTAVLYPMILRNRKTLLRKHPTISGRKSAERLKRIGGSGSAGRPKTRPLIIEGIVSDLRRGVGCNRAVQLRRQLHDLEISFDLLALYPSSNFDECEFPDIAHYRAWMPSEAVENVLNSEAAAYSHIWVYGAHNLSELVAPLKAYKDRYDTTIICDVETLAVRQAIEVAQFNGRPYSDADTVDLATSELSGTVVADHLIVADERDAALIRATGMKPVSVVGYSATGMSLSRTAWAERNGIVVSGTVNSELSPMFNSIRWFVESVLPKIGQSGIKLTIEGHWPEQLLQSFLKVCPTEMVDFIGAVSDDARAELYGHALLAVAPMRFAGGDPCKAIEAMSTGVPIVLSRAAGDQIGLTDDERDLLAVAPVDDDGESFAKAIEHLLDDGERWTAVRDAQLAFAARNFSPETLARDYMNLFQDTGITASLDSSFSESRAEFIGER